MKNKQPLLLLILFSCSNEPTKEDQKFASDDLDNLIINNLEKINNKLDLLEEKVIFLENELELLPVTSLVDDNFEENKSIDIKTIRQNNVPIRSLQNKEFSNDNVLSEPESLKNELLRMFNENMNEEEEEEDESEY
jgi:hypothetical protein|tara:strand:+ start:703 stop:1110 length:408 start_codon:yes stop_codon:yes gene_type:complete